MIARCNSNSAHTEPFPDPTIIPIPASWENYVSTSTPTSRCYCISPDHTSTGDNVHLRIVGTCDVSPFLEPQQFFPMALVRCSRLPALPTHYLTEISPRLCMCDSSVLFLSDGHQDLLFTGTGALEPGASTGSSSAHLFLFPLRSLRPPPTTSSVASLDYGPHSLPENASSCDAPSEATTDSDASPSDLLARFLDQKRLHFS